MKIAIIVNDDKTIYYLQDVINKTTDWDVSFFSDSQKFGMSDISYFDVIIVSYSLPLINGQDLLESIHEKTSADLYLLCDLNDCISKADLSRDYIKGVIKKDISSIINKLHYLETKYRIKKMITIEDENMSNMVVRANGYSFDIDNDVAFIGIKRVLSAKSKTGLLKKIGEANVDKVVISYPDIDRLKTIHCFQIFDIYKHFFTNGGKVVFCNPENISVDVLHECKIDKIMPIFDNQEEAVSFLHT